MTVGEEEARRFCVITGGTSGIGLAIAHRLARDGFDLLLTGRDRGRGERAAGEVRDAAGTDVFFSALCVEEWASYGRLLDEIGGRAVDAVVASAGEGIEAHLLDTGRKEFDRLLSINVTAPVHLVQVLCPLLAGGAAVVLISSDAGVDGEQEIGAYSVTKAALIMAGKMLALDLAPRGVRVNTVCPGDTVPGMRSMLRPGETKRGEEEYLSWPLPPRGRWGEAGDTAEAVAFLVSSRADFILGANLLIDGGSRAGRPDRARPHVAGRTELERNALREKSPHLH